MGSGTQALLFLIETLFTLITALFILCFWMQAARIGYRSALARFVVKTTQPLLEPLRRVIPNIAGQDTASAVAAVIFSLLKLMSLSLVLFGYTPNPLALILGAVLGVVLLAIKMAIWLIIGQAVMSWFSPYDNPLYATLYALTEPLLRPIRQMLPLFGGFDLSPIVAIIILQVVSIFLSGLA